MDKGKIIQYITGNIIDQDEKAEVRNWIDQDKTNKQLFIQLKNTFALSRKSSGVTDVDQEYRKLHRKTNKHPKKISIKFIQYAAIIILTIGLTLFIQEKYFYGQKTETTQMNEVICPPGQISELILSDGSHIWLNAGSRIFYPAHFSRQQRSVQLEGEAFLEVTRDKKNPFLVKTSKMDIKVLGTSFNVEAYKEDQFVKTTLVEGKIELQNKTGDKIAEVSPGQLARYNINNNEIYLSKVDTRFYSSWKEGKMTFFNEPMEEIALKLERWYNVKITFSSEDIKSYRFSGTFLKYKPLEQILQIIKLSSPVDYQVRINAENKNEIILKKLN